MEHTGWLTSTACALVLLVLHGWNSGNLVGAFSIQVQQPNKPLLLGRNWRIHSIQKDKEDLEGDRSLSSNHPAVTSKEEYEREIAELEEMGGDPSFLVDLPVAVGGAQSLDNETEENTSSSNVNVLSRAQLNLEADIPDKDQDWFRVGRQLAQQFKESSQETEEESNGYSETEGFTDSFHEEDDYRISLAELEATGGDSFFLEDTKANAEAKVTTEGEATTNDNMKIPPLEEAQIVSLDVASQLVLLTKTICQSNQKALTEVQLDIMKLEEQLTHLRSREKYLQMKLADAVANQQESIRKKHTLQSAFASLGGFASPVDDHGKVLVQRPPDRNDGPYFTAMEGDSFDNLHDELEALGGDPFFLDANGRGDNAEDDTFVADRVRSTVLLNPSQNQGRGMEKHTARVVRKGLLKSKLTNEVEEEEFLTEEEAMMEVGGDPAFLDSYDKVDHSPAYDKEMLREELLEMGGDPFFL